MPQLTHGITRKRLSSQEKEYKNPHDECEGRIEKSLGYDKQTSRGTDFSHDDKQWSWGMDFSILLSRPLRDIGVLFKNWHLLVRCQNETWYLDRRRHLYE